MYMCSPKVPMWVYVHQMCTGAQGGQNTVSLLELSLGAVVRQLKWILETNPGPLPEQQVLLTTESSFQTQIYKSLKYNYALRNFQNSY